MAHRGWWPTAQHSVTDIPVHSKIYSGMKPAPQMSAASSNTASSAASVCIPPKQLCPGLPSSSLDATSSPEEASAEDLDWQTLCLQTILHRPNSAEPLQATATKSRPREHISPDMPAQSQRSPGHELPEQPGSLGAPLPQKHSSTSAEAQSHALHYAAVFLDRLSVAKLLAWSPPVHSCPTADHMTLLFRPTYPAAEQLPLGTSVELTVLAKMHNSITQVTFVVGSCMYVGHGRILVLGFAVMACSETCAYTCCCFTVCLTTVVCSSAY